MKLYYFFDLEVEDGCVQIRLILKKKGPHESDKLIICIFLPQKQDLFSCQYCFF